MSTVPTIRLNDGHSIPQLGFGVFQIEPEDTARAVGRALEIGCRHIDTAQMYGNETGVGEAVRTAGLDRADVFLTSKLSNGFHRPDDARRAFDQTLRGIATQAWSPIAQGKLLDDPAITAIAERLGRSPAQVILAWHIQRGNIVFPKSTTPARIRENFELFDFQLEPGDIEKIDALDDGKPGRIGANPDAFADIPPDAVLATGH